MSKKLVYGVGINDSCYATQTTEELPKVRGKRVSKVTWRCPYYQKWAEMLRRCYSKTTNPKHKTYVDCVVCDEWLTFSNFKSWLEKQNWEGMCLDKDVIVVGNKLYSPNTCALVTIQTNNFILDSAAQRGELPLGVYLDKRRNVYVARCHDPFKKNKPYIGVFNTPEEAHLAWKAKKHEYACMLADLQYDPRVADALRKRYL